MVKLAFTSLGKRELFLIATRTKDGNTEPIKPRILKRDSSPKSKIANTPLVLAGRMGFYRIDSRTISIYWRFATFGFA